MKKFFTVTKCEIFDRILDRVLSGMESSSPYGVCIGYEDGTIELRNAVNKKEHASLEAAQEYAKNINDAAYDQLMEEHETHPE